MFEDYSRLQGRFEPVRSASPALRADSSPLPSRRRPGSPARSSSPTRGPAPRPSQPGRRRRRRRRRCGAAPAGQRRAGSAPAGVPAAPRRASRASGVRGEAAGVEDPAHASRRDRARPGARGREPDEQGGVAGLLPGPAALPQPARASGGDRRAANREQARAAAAGAAAGAIDRVAASSTRTASDRARRAPGARRSPAETARRGCPRGRTSRGRARRAGCRAAWRAPRRRAPAPRVRRVRRRPARRGEHGRDPARGRARRRTARRAGCAEDPRRGSRRARRRRRRRRMSSRPPNGSRSSPEPGGEGQGVDREVPAGAGRPRSTRPRSRRRRADAFLRPGRRAGPAGPREEDRAAEARPLEVGRQRLGVARHGDVDSAAGVPSRRSRSAPPTIQAPSPRAQRPRARGRRLRAPAQPLEVSCGLRDPRTMALAGAAARARPAKTPTISRMTSDRPVVTVERGPQGRRAGPAAPARGRPAALDRAALAHPRLHRPARGDPEEAFEPRAARRRRRPFAPTTRWPAAGARRSRRTRRAGSTDTASCPASWAREAGS